MKNILRLEELTMFALSIYLNKFLPFEWWMYWVFFLAPDISLLGYAVNSQVGALAYNLLHHKGVAIACYIIGTAFSVELLQFVGLLLFGHSSFDRMLGYGLKHSDSFHNTHLGWIGKHAHGKQ
jgi:hypothetical protein